MPSKIGLIIAACLAGIVLLTFLYSQLSVWQQAMFCVFVALGWGYEFSSYQRRGRLVRIQWASDARVILHYAHGLTVEAPLSPSAFANRWFIYYRAGKAKHMIYRDALHPEDYRRLTVYLMWCRS